MIYNLLKKKLILPILVFALIIRIWDISLPFFSPGEVRIALRGFYISEELTDELGRRTPLLFNGNKDYEFPATSYLTALGIKLLGKNDYGVRVPFIILGVAWIFLLYKVGQEVFRDNLSANLMSFIAAISPVTVFLSKIPNEFVISWFLLTIFFFLLLKEKLHFFLILSVVILLFLSSKNFLFITFLLITFILWFKSKGKIFDDKKSLSIVVASLIVTIFALALFFNIPQAVRSLAENNLTLFTNPDNQTNLNVLRGHGLKEGVNPTLEKLLFNKLSLLGLGVINYLNYFNPVNYFGNINDGHINYSNFGLLPKAIIVPFILGVYYILKFKRSAIFLFISALFFLNGLFVFPDKNVGVSLNSIPFILLIAASGIKNTKKFINIAVLFLVILEAFLLFSSSGVEAKKVEKIRSSWIVPIVEDVYKSSKLEPTYVSDDLVDNLDSYLSWFTNIKLIDEKNSLIKFPYKYNSELKENIKYIRDDTLFFSCILKSGEIIKNTAAFVSPRDHKKVTALIGEKYLKQFQSKLYYDSFGNVKAYKISNALCY